MNILRIIIHSDYNSYTLITITWSSKIRLKWNIMLAKIYIKYTIILISIVWNFSYSLFRFVLSGQKNKQK